MSCLERAQDEDKWSPYYAVWSDYNRICFLLLNIATNRPRVTHPCMMMISLSLSLTSGLQRVRNMLNSLGLLMMWILNVRILKV